MTAEQIRTFLFEWLRRRASRDSLQFHRCLQGINSIVTQSPYDLPVLTEQDSQRLYEVIWDLIIERVLVPGRGSHGNDGWPWLSVTPFGEAVLKSSTPVPYDPEGYLKQIASIGGVHPTIVEYVAEALATFRAGAFLASAVMLGAASEKLIDELAAALPKAVFDETKATKYADRMQRGKMKDRLTCIVGWCRNHKSSLPGNWSGDERAEDVDRIADLIRRRRNDAGHPQDPPMRPTREQMYSYLMVFPDYCRHLSELKTWADTNPAVIV